MPLDRLRLHARPVFMSLHPVSEALIAQLSQRLPAKLFRNAEPRYLEEPRGRFFAKSGMVALPETVEHVATIVRACNEARVGIVPFSGGTGLVGGQVKSEGIAPLILSLEKMNHVRDVFPEENVMIAEAGVILADIQSAAEAHNRLFPLSLASEGSARIGGNLSTNAGGVNVLRYGNTRDLCLGLEAVLPNGEIWNGLSRLRKDNTGYDLKNLFIGAEGSLGIVTAASLKLFARPAQYGCAMMVVPSPAAALSLLSLARDQMAEGISAFELMHRQSLDFLSEVLPDVRQPFADKPEWMVLIDVGLSQGQNPPAALEILFAKAFETGLVSDGIIAQSESQRSDFWTVRERIPDANRLIGSISSHDISIPISRIGAFIGAGAREIAKIGEFRINCFGHLGDGNLHYNIFPPKGRVRNDYDAQRGAVKAAVHDLVHRFDGSFSAEHGVGRLKTDDLTKYGDPTKLSVMRAIKQVLDPNGIMNPGAVFPEQ